MKLNRALRAIVLGGVFLLPFVPLVVSTTMFFPFITAKNFAFRSIVEIIFTAWLILALRDPAYRPPRSPLLYALLGFLGIIALADIFGVHLYGSFWSNFERMEGYITLLHLAAYFFVIGATLRTEQLWKRFFHTSMAASAVMGLYGIFQLLGWATINQGGVRLDGRLGNATYLAIYMLFHIFLTAFYLVRHRGAKGARWVYATLIALQTVILVYTASRGVVLGLVFGAMVTALLIILFERAPEHRVARRVSLGAVVGIVLLVGVFATVRNVPAVRNHEILGRFASISISEGFSRFKVWNMAWQGFLERPFLGWGQNNFDVVFNKYYDPSMYSQEPWFDRTHNVVFDWLIAGGILGLMAYLSLFATGLTLLWKRSSRNTLGVTDKAIVSGLLAGYFFQLLFVFDNITSYFFFFSVLAYLHARLGNPLPGSIWGSITARRELVERIGIPVVVVASVFVFYTVNVKPFLTARSLIQSLVRQSGGAAENLALFKQTIGYGTFGTAEAREQLVQSALQIASAEESIVSQQLKQEFITYTVDQMRIQVEQAPHAARTWFFYGSFLRRVGRTDEAEEALHRARELSPKKQLIALELGLLHATAGRHDESLAILKETFESAPAYNDGRVYYALVAIRAGKYDLAKELLAGDAGAAASDDERILRTYLEAKQYGEVVAILNRRIEKNPTRIEGYVSLAAAYVQSGNKTKAIQTLQSAIKIDPEFKAQGEQFIADIRAGKI